MRCRISAAIFFSSCPGSPRPVSPLWSSHAEPIPPAVFHRARRLRILPSAVLLRDRKAGRRASRLSRFPQPDHSATETRSTFFPTAHRADTSRQPNRKMLAANRVAGFTRSMGGPNNAGSKLSACPTRQNGKRQAVSCFELGKEGQTPSVASSPVPQAAADTLRVSASSASPPGFRQPVCFCVVRCSHAAV